MGHASYASSYVCSVCSSGSGLLLCSSHAIEPSGGGGLRGRLRFGKAIPVANHGRPKHEFIERSARHGDRNRAER
jgi:hypothetical protein